MAPEAENEDEGDKKEPPAEKTFTQSEVNRMMANEKRDGKRAGKRELLDELGFDDVEDLRKKLDAVNDAEDAAKSDAQRAQEEADAEKAKAKKAREDAERERHEARVERAIIKAGGDPDNEKSVSRITRLLDIEVGADSDEIAAAVESLKDDMPTLFETSKPSGKEEGTPPGEGEGEKKDPPKPNIPGSDLPKPPRFAGANSAKDSALARLRDRHPQTASD